MGDIVHVSWADLLLSDGVDAKGYGKIPKLVMIDHDLSYKAKAIYAYLCSLAGKGTTAFPGRDTIINALGITKDTYYVHFNALKEYGYISVRRESGADGRYGHNIYTLESNPKKLQDYESPAGEGSRLRSRGIHQAGYGSIPQMVMNDDRLSIKAKAFYAYLASFAGAGDVAFPAQKDLLYHMDMSPVTYRKAMRALIACNYIEVTQRAENGRFDRCDYYIVSNPDAARGEEEIRRRNSLYADRKPPVKKAPKRIPQKKAQRNEPAADHSQNSDKTQTIRMAGVSPDDSFSDMAQTADITRIAPHDRISDMINPDMEKSDTVKSDVVESDTVDQDIINNSLTKNSFTNINPTTEELVDLEDITGFSSELLYAFDHDLMTDEEKEEYIQTECLALDYYKKDPHYDVRGIRLLVQLVVKAGHATTMMVQGQAVSRAEFMTRFLSLGIDEYQYVLDSVARQKGEIQNLKKYYLTCLYFAKENYMLEVDRDIRGWTSREV